MSRIVLPMPYLLCLECRCWFAFSFYSVYCVKRLWIHKKITRIVYASAFLFCRPFFSFNAFVQMDREAGREKENIIVARCDEFWSKMYLGGRGEGRFRSISSSLIFLLDQNVMNANFR